MANIMSDPSKFSPNVVSGGVQGTFYGAGAQALAGVTDVTLSPNYGSDLRMVQPRDNIRHVDLFATKLVVPKPTKPE
jgi:hypothetical protein